MEDAEHHVKRSNTPTTGKKIFLLMLACVLLLMSKTTVALSFVLWLWNQRLKLGEFGCTETK